MKKTLLLFVFIFIAIGVMCAQQNGYPITPVPFTSVKITDNFWQQRLNANRQVTIPLSFSKSQETGRYENFVKAIHPSEDYDVTKIEPFPFDDTDVYKVIEGAAYSLQMHPDKALEKFIDSVLVIVAAAQEPDGYLYTARTMNPAHPHSWAGSSRWVREERGSHELYNLGHMIEGAIAYYQATGKRNFLDIAIKYADCVCREIGENPNQFVAVPGHQIAEMALAKLFLVTNDAKYLNEAKFFLDKRGYTARHDAYDQTHKPILEQDEAVGHAVRAGYLYSGIADVAALTGDTAYIRAIDRIWDNVVSKKLYVTGGIGARHGSEAFGDNYELPNAEAYNETCAAIANVYWNYRLFLLHGDAKYFDVLERTLYNGLLSGVSLDGGSFFYPNPLASKGDYERQAWFGCACCPSNICRFMPSVPGYVYALKDNNLYVNLFVGNEAELNINNKKVVLKQTTDYPFDGKITMEISPEKTMNFGVKIRIPNWLRGEVVPSDLYQFSDGKNLNYTVKINGKSQSKSAITASTDGYLTINKKWKRGDVIEVQFDMQPRTVVANEKVTSNIGRVSVEMGPLVYCVESVDNKYFTDINDAELPQNPQFSVSYQPTVLNGINEISVKTRSNNELKLIPYYAWANRGNSQMEVWIKSEK